MDISQITSSLFVAASPQGCQRDQLIARKIGLVISMIAKESPPQSFARPPLQMLWLPCFDSVFLPIPLTYLARGVESALPIIQRGQSVLVYCAQGRHRSVAMAAAILIAEGRTARQSADLLMAKRNLADPQAAHIYARILAFESFWQNKKAWPRSFSEAYAEYSTRFSLATLQHLRPLNFHRE